MNLTKEAQARLDWLLWRQGGLGGSDVMQVLLGPEDRPYGGPWDVWLSKTQTIGIDEATEAQAIGNWLERPIADWVGTHLGRTVTEADPVQGSQGWMRCTPDFWLTGGDSAPEGLECKVSFKSAHWADGVPPYVLLQALWCMMCTDTQVWHVGAFLPMNRRRGNWLIERNAELEAAVLERTHEWWERHVIKGEQPEVDGSKSCTDALFKIYPEVKVHKVLTANEAQDALLGELVDLNLLLKASGARKREIINTLISDVGEHQGIQGTGGGVRWDQRKAVTRLDSKKLKEAHPALWDEFSTTGEPSRAARVIIPKEKKCKK